MLDDSGADQCIVNINSFLICTRTGEYFDVGGATNEMRTTVPLELVNDAYTLVHLKDGTKVVFKINQAFCDTDSTQTEALLATHQVRDFGVSIDNCAKCHLRHDGTPGSQSISTPNGNYEFHFDGKKCYFDISKPTQEDLQTYPVVVLTSNTLYEPRCRDHSIRRKKFSPSEIAHWRACLGFPTYGVTKRTLDNTTQMVKTLEAETREYLRDYHKTRVYALRPKRINDVMFTDTFFSSIVSIRGFCMFQLFCYKKSKYNVVKLMKRESQVPTAYEDCVIEHGAPNRVVTDNAKALTSNRFRNISRKYCISVGNTVPYAQHQNYAEGEGGNFKFAVRKCMHYTPHAPIEYWCYCATFLDKVRRHLAKAALDHQSAITRVDGNTNDISVFRFPWFSPVWYYDPLTSFPHDQMSPGFFLDLAENTGDSFSYVILPVKEVKKIPTKNHNPIVRNIVRPRDLKCEAPPKVRNDKGSLTFWNDQGQEIFAEEELDHSLISDRLGDIPGVTADEVRAALEPTSPITDIRDRDSLSRIDGRLPTIPEEPPEESVTEEADDTWSDLPPVDEPIRTIQDSSVDEILEPVPKRQRTSPDSHDDELPIISQTQEPDDYDSTDEQEQDPIPASLAPDSESFDDLAAQVNGVLDVDNDSTRDLEKIISHRITSGVLELEV